MPAKNESLVEENQSFNSSSQRRFLQLKKSIRDNFQYDYPEVSYSAEEYTILLNFCKMLKKLNNELKISPQLIFLAAVVVENKRVLADPKHKEIEEKILSEYEVKILEEYNPVLKEIKESFYYIFPAELSLKEYSAACEFYRMLKKLAPVLKNSYKNVLLSAALTANKTVLQDLISKKADVLETLFSEEEVILLEECLPELKLEHNRPNMIEPKNKLWFRFSKEKKLLNLVVLSGIPKSVETMLELNAKVNPSVDGNYIGPKWFAEVTVSPLMSAILQYERSVTAAVSSEEISTVQTSVCFRIVELLIAAGADAEKHSALPCQVRVNDKIASQSIEPESYCQQQSLGLLVELFKSKSKPNGKHKSNPKELSNDNNVMSGPSFSG